MKVTRKEVSFCAAGDSVKCVVATHAQCYTRNMIYRLYEYDSLMVPFKVEILKPCGINHVIAVVIKLIERHEALRTLFNISNDGNLCQEIYSSGYITVNVIEHENGDAAEVADSFIRQQDKLRFDSATEFPAKIAVTVCSGVPKYVAFVLSHMAADAFSSDILRKEIYGSLNGGNSYTPPPVLWTPFDQSTWENSLDGRKKSDNALNYWARTLERFPIAMFSSTNAIRTPGRWKGFDFFSPSLGTALNFLSLQHRVSTGSALLTLLALSLEKRVQASNFATKIVFNNRIGKKFANSVGNYAMPVPINIDLPFNDPGASFRNMQSGLISSYRYANFDYEKIGMMLAANSVTRDVVIDSYFNMVHRSAANRPDPRYKNIREEIAQKRSQTIFSLREERDYDIHTISVHSWSCSQILMYVDGNYISNQFARRMLYFVEEKAIDLCLQAQAN